MDESGSIPVMKQPRNMMEVGPNGNNLQAQARRRHPIDDLQRTAGTKNKRTALNVWMMEKDSELQ